MADKLLLLLMSSEQEWLGEKQDPLIELCSDYDFIDDTLPFQEIKDRLSKLL